MDRNNLNFVGIALMLIAGLFLLPFVLAINVEAETRLNHLLQGDYVFTSNLQCIASPDGFDPDTLVPLGPTTNKYDATLSYVAHYDGNGVVSATGDQLANFHWYPPGDPETRSTATQVWYECVGTYSVNSDRSFTQKLECSGGFIRPPLPLSFKVTDVEYLGQVSVNGLTLLISGTGGKIEPVYYNSVVSNYRICNTSGTATKMNAK